MGAEGYWGEERAVPGQRSELELKLGSEALGWVWSSQIQPLETSSFAEPISTVPLVAPL